MMRNLSTVPAASLAHYIDTVLKTMTEPTAFFASEKADGARWPVAVLLLSALVHTGAALLLYVPARPWTVAVILFVNAVGTPLVAAVFGYVLVRATMGGRIRFSEFFGVYGYASAVVLLVTWMPYAAAVAEPWRWWLIGKGLMRGCGFSFSAALVIIGVTLIAMFSGFQVLMRLSAQLN